MITQSMSKQKPDLGKGIRALLENMDAEANLDAGVQKNGCCPYEFHCAGPD